jgi:hypothetical protein
MGLQPMFWHENPLAPGVQIADQQVFRPYNRVSRSGKSKRNRKRKEYGKFREPQGKLKDFCGSPTLYYFLAGCTICFSQALISRDLSSTFLPAIHAAAPL